MPSEKSIYNPNPAISQNAYISSMEEYKKFYEESLDNPEEFWSRVAKQFHWETPAEPKKFLQYNFDITKGPISIKWMEGASTNICYNLLDRNIRNGLGDTIAYYCEHVPEIRIHQEHAHICLKAIESRNALQGEFVLKGK
ncbi:Acetyl-coenzyme A synthetase [Lucilia cuprina]|nr:Acetyl-coenzyme A synthetase [Lucilia cuprina]